MKTIKQISKIFLAAIIIAVSINTSFAQERKESFEKNFQVNSAGYLSFSCYDTDLKINTWQKNEVKLMGVIIIEGGDKEDQDELIEVFKDPEVSQSPNSLGIETNMAKSTIGFGPFMSITLVNGKKVNIKKFKVSYTLWIPESIALNLRSKYNNIDIATLKGDINFDLYEADLTLASFKNGKFNMKYSSADIGSGENAKFDVYECEIEIKDINTCNVNTKYSEFNIKNAGSITLGSYEDQFEIMNLTHGLTGQAKYSNFIIESDVEYIKIDVYESDIEVKNIKELAYTSKYSSFKALNIGSAKCESLYETEIYATNVGNFSCTESKYDEIEFESIGKSLVFTSAYELDLKVQNAKSGFENFKGDFKYGSVNLLLDPALEFSLKFNTNYGDVDFPKNRLKITEMIFDDSKKYFEGQTSDNPPCKIEFTAYDTEFVLH
jgi:hypothetical protein